MSTILKAVPNDDDAYLERALPAAVEVERTILGCVLMSPECRDSAAEIMTRTDDFFLVAHRKIWDAMAFVAAKGEAPEIVAVLEELRRAGDLEAVGGAAYLHSLLDGGLYVASVASYARRVKDKAVLRRLIQAGQHAVQAAFEPDADAATVAAEAETEILAANDVRPDHLPEMVGAVIQARVEHLERLAAGEKLDGIATGFRDFDGLTGGLRKGTLVIVAGRPGMGKTVLGLDIAHGAAKQDETVLFCSQEMTNAELGNRLLASEARVDLHRISTAYLGAEDWARIRREAFRFDERPLLLWDHTGATVAQLAAECRRVRREHGLGLVVIDYLQLLQPERERRTRVEEVSQLSRDVKRLAKRLNVPVVALAQLSRACETRDDKRPKLADLRDSGEIEQDADLVAFLYRHEVYNPAPEHQGRAELLIRKNRQGPLGTIRLTFLKEFVTFENTTEEWR